MRRRRGIGQRLQESRKRLKLTQETVARRAHITAKYVSEIENEHASPSINVLERAVELGLGIPMAAFFSADDPSDVRDDLAKMRSLLAGQSAAVRRQALRVIRALCGV